MRVKEKLVRNARLKKEYSQEYVAQILGVSQSKYSRLEKEETTFDIEELSRLIDLLELNPLEVIDFTEKQQVFINSSYSENSNITINGLDKDVIRDIIREEIKKQSNL